MTTPSLAWADTAPQSPPPRVDAFLHHLFRGLDDYDVLYCVLHSYDRLPELSSDLDLAVRPADFDKLLTVLNLLGELGYELVQRFNYAIGGNFFTFIWFEEQTLISVNVDVITEHWRNGLCFASGEALIAGRRKYSGFWIPAPAVEFEYLLAKKVLKQNVKLPQQDQLRELARELGLPIAHRIAAELFGKRKAVLVVNACLAGELIPILPTLRSAIRRQMHLRRWMTPLRWLVGETKRYLARFRQPTGLTITLIGPDGVGKTTLIQALSPPLSSLFRRTKICHWRTSILRSETQSGVSTDPHSQPRATSLSSVTRLAAHFVDHWCGYLLQIRPFLARSGVVLFDRCFQDVLVDPIRYRYYGPRWFARLLCRFSPKPDLALVLEAPEQLIFSRKQEVQEHEIGRQRRSYIALAATFPRSNCLDASNSVELLTFVAVESIASLLSTRLERRNSPSTHTALQRIVRVITGRPPSIAHQPSEHAIKKPRNDRKMPSEYTYAVLPSRHHPRWLVPIGDRELSARGWDIYVPQTQLGTATHRLRKSLLRVGWTGGRKDRLILRASSLEPLRAFVTETTGHKHAFFSFSIGIPQRFSKLTIQVLSSSAETLGYIKLPLSIAATERVRIEGSTLTRLQNIDSFRPHIPDLLFAGEWQDTPILFQSSCGGKPGPACFTESHEEFLGVLAKVDAEKRNASAVVEEIAKLCAAAESRLNAVWCRLIEHTLEHSAHALGQSSLDCSLTHGDFAPWNSRLADKKLKAFDWESARPGLPVGWDYCHFQVQSTTLLARPWSPRHKFLDANGGVPVLLLYLISSVAGLANEGVSLNHGAIARRQKLLLDLLKQ